MAQSPVHTPEAISSSGFFPIRGYSNKRWGHIYRGLRDTEFRDSYQRYYETQFCFCFLAIGWAISSLFIHQEFTIVSKHSLIILAVIGHSCLPVFGGILVKQSQSI